jgi:hypothetical protein
LELIQDWLNVHISILERWESRNNFGFSQLSESSSYAQTLAKILSISVPGVNHGFVSATGLQKLDELVNKMKSLALEALNHVLRYIFEKVPNSVKKNSAFLSKSIQFCPFLA